MLPANLPFRIGTTSYIIPADILPNARYLAGKIQDIQLVLFEMEDAQNNLPDTAQIAELSELANEHQLSYTVHLPLDLRLGATGSENHISLQKAQRVIEATRPLNPLAYIVHLDGREERHSVNPDVLSHWQQQAAASLHQAAKWTGNMKLLAVENLESYPIGFNDPVIAMAGSARCIDIGHLWLDDHDPVQFFPGRIEQTIVIHLHGIKERDHKSLAHMSQKRIDDFFHILLQSGFSGVLTLEVFSEDDFNTSMQAVADSLLRLQGNNG
ncbi:MAG: cobamide remodeling phosphodiesterase CbiR [Leptolinea sp.]